MMRSDILTSPPEMHILDGYLSLVVALVCWAIAAAGVRLALRRSRRSLDERHVPLMGVLAAFVFAAQMLNFTVIVGISGHLIGGALSAILMGPWPGILIMTTVTAIQALAFQDGGLLVMGANILNLAIISTLVAYGVHRGVRLISGGRRWGVLVGGFAAAWASVVVSSAATATQLGFSGMFPIGLALPAMVGIHALIGIGEGLITVGALALVSRVRPDLVEFGRPVQRGGMRWTLAGLAVALVVVLLSPLASPHPDGLERVAEDFGFTELAQDASYQLIPDYSLPGVSNETLATVAAGATGVLVVFGVAASLAAVYRRVAMREA